MPEQTTADDQRLFDLYKLAIDEYRFEVRLGWDRSVYFLVINSGILSVATGLMKADSSRWTSFFVAGIFLLGFATSVMGVLSVRKSHEYYRRTIVKKTFIEFSLGLTKPAHELYPAMTLAVGTTEGQVDHATILGSPDEYVGKKHRKTAISFLMQCVIGGIGIIDIAGFVISTLGLWLSTPDGSKLLFVFNR